ncbi:chemotaxis protein CheX [Gracilimonas mengyeensis]|uniref:Chemotaxis phosphatase CheX n=1 Tax=Gracilimonas mengyeensis TaxID=1302730 RepID=A0A521D7C1_9BACT|nr:chemotaxis protein CheX [Gracilimonas mengyeensis]SMO67495.1 Chemotaxis phosphatase CheX [Gracilimonas mengyeensis]
METELTNKTQSPSAGYQDQIQEIAYNIFELTCYMFPMEEWELEDAGELERPDGNVRSIVRFDGAAEGAMVISPSEDLLEALAANMLGVEEANDEEKEGALCEIANIICGNTVPLFAHDEQICYIRPPRIAAQGEDTDELFKGMTREDVEVLLDEGIAEISIYYNAEDL